MKILFNLYWAYCAVISINSIGYTQPLQEFPPGYAVASAHPLATNAGLAILKKGGNAFDAAIAVAAVLAVVEPYNSGLGGGAFWLLHQQKDHKNIFIDSREVAPKAAYKNMFLDAQGHVMSQWSLNGGLAAGIPGEPAAFVYIAQHYGRMPLSTSLAPAIELAEQGFLVDQEFVNHSNILDRVAYLKKYPATAAIFLNKGIPFTLNQRLVQKDLAQTLKILAQEGHNGFYKGIIAQRLVQGVNQAGGIWSLDDLARYQVTVREPLVGAYHNMLVITAPPPSAGGVALLTMLNMLSNYSLSSFTQAQWTHYLIEVMRLAYWQRDQYLGDPDFVKIPLNYLLSAANAKQLIARITPDRPINNKTLKSHKTAHKEHTNTTHFSIIDSEGNRVAATLTLNYVFGSSVVAAGTGVLLNDEMDDFANKTGSPNVFGLVGSELNAIAPYKKPLSNMAPTFLEMPGRVAIVGTPGGSRIPTMVLLASLAFYKGYGAISMVSAMRFHHQYLPDVVQFEPDAFPPKLQQSLHAMGYQLAPLERYYGDMQAITWDKEHNVLTATADPRHIGLAVVIKKQQEKQASTRIH